MAVGAQLLDGRAKLPKGKEGVARIIEKLGYVQIDTISVIQRAHHHTLWTRRSDYKPETLNQLLAEDRRVFEYWGHAASYLPMTDYRFYLPWKRRFLNPHDKWIKVPLEKYGHLMKPLLERIRKEGPLSSADLESGPGKRPRVWWDWKPLKVAMELLFWRGELMITARRNFERVYDLTERVLPDDVDTTFPSEEELGQFLVRRALSAYGIADEGEIRKHLNVADDDTFSKGLGSLIDAGEIIPVEVKDIENKGFYALKQNLESGSKLRKASAPLHLLSPFDNLIIQRSRLRRLFGFDYALECYTPPARRKYGYFVLPILWGEQFAGRLDPKADRKAKTLIIKNLVFESAWVNDEELMTCLVAKLWDLARFNNCDKIKIMKVSPAKIKKELERQAKRSEPVSAA